MVFTRVREATSFLLPDVRHCFIHAKRSFSFIATFLSHTQRAVNPDPLQFSFPPIWHKTTIHDYSWPVVLFLMFSLIFLPRLFDVTVMESPHPMQAAPSQRGRMNTLRTSSIIVAGHAWFRHSLQFTGWLICFNFRCFFFVCRIFYRVGPQYFLLSTAIYMSLGWASTRNDSCARSCVSTPSWEKSWTMAPGELPWWCLKRWCPSFCGIRWTAWDWAVVFDWR